MKRLNIWQIFVACRRRKEKVRFFWRGCSFRFVVLFPMFFCFIHLIFVNLIFCSFLFLDYYVIYWFFVVLFPMFFFIHFIFVHLCFLMMFMLFPHLGFNFFRYFFLIHLLFVQMQILSKMRICLLSVGMTFQTLDIFWNVLMHLFMLSLLGTRVVRSNYCFYKVVFPTHNAFGESMLTFVVELTTTSSSMFRQHPPLLGSDSKKSDNRDCEMGNETFTNCFW